MPEKERLGEYLIRIHALSFEQAEEVLRIQQMGSKKKFGEIAVELGYIYDLDMADFIISSEKE